MAYIYKTAPLRHQSETFLRSRDLTAFAIFDEQGLGKTKQILDTSAYLYGQGKIQALLIVTLNDVHRDWIELQIPEHLPDDIPIRTYTHHPRNNKKSVAAFESLFDQNFTGLRIFSIYFEGALAKRGKQMLPKFLRAFNTLMVIDESSAIKTPRAKRTTFLINMGKLAKYRRILNGTPIIQTPLNAYSQFKFLDPSFFNFSTFTEFRQHYAVVEMKLNLQATLKKGRDVYYADIKSYKNLDEFQQVLTRHASRATKSKCLDLPEKIYKRQVIMMTVKQDALYKDMLSRAVNFLKEDSFVKIPSGLTGEEVIIWSMVNNLDRVTAKNGLVEFLRLQQITGGFLPDKDGNGLELDSINPKINAVLDIVDNTDSHILTFAVYRAELAALIRTLNKRAGYEIALGYYGGVERDERTENKKRFLNPHDPCRVLVGHPSPMGYGHTFINSDTVIYFSHHPSIEKRLQSEDRPHRIGQKKCVLYIDLVCRNSIDEKILEGYKNKMKISDNILGEDNAEWLKCL